MTKTDKNGYLTVIHPGSMTTIQDLGRWGYQDQGIPVGGVVDAFAARAANLLLGNKENDAVLECTLKGPVFYFSKATWIAVCGADVSIRISMSHDNIGFSVSEVQFPSWSSYCVPKHAVVSVGMATHQSRMYIAIKGGICVPKVIGSRSTYSRATMGGYQGRALQALDMIPIQLDDKGECTPIPTTSIVHTPHVIARMQPPEWYLQNPHIHILHVLPGPEYDQFLQHGDMIFSVTSQMDRMGCRLQGKEALIRIREQEMYSEAVVEGSVQVPPSGQPIILLAERQTIGGYPIPYIIIRADLSKAAQLRPGTQVTFKVIDVETARAMWLEQEYHLRVMAAGISLNNRYMKQ